MRGVLKVVPILCILSCNPFTGDGNNNSEKYDPHRQACVDRINAFRATENLPPLERWTEQESCSDAQARSDYQSGTPHGAFGDCEERAQNECLGHRSLDGVIESCLQSMWDERLLPEDAPYSQRGHYINMSNTNYTRVSCGFYETPEGRVWAVQNFR